MNRLIGKTAVMTAAGSGIGRASALMMAQEGALVYATDINTSFLESLKAGNDAIITRSLDATDPAAIRALAGDLPPVDILFNCAGYVHHGTVLDADEDIWMRSFELNVLSHARMIEAFLPGMIESNGGSIINMASVVSSITAAINRCVYGTTKGAVIGLTKSIARDYVGDKIRCNAICPGTIMTPSLQERLEAGGDYDTALQNILTRQPTRELGLPEDVANMVVYLASDESRLSTGQNFVIDGGWTI